MKPIFSMLNFTRKDLALHGSLIVPILLFSLFFLIENTGNDGTFFTDAISKLYIFAIWFVLFVLYIKTQQTHMVAFYFTVFTVYIFAENLTFGHLNVENVFFYVTLFSFLCIADTILSKLTHKKLPKISLLATSAFRSKLLLIPVCILIYTYSEDAVFNRYAILAILQSNASESYEYIIDYISIHMIIVFIICILFTFYYSKQKLSKVNSYNNIAMFAIIGVILSFIFYFNKDQSRLFTLIISTNQEYFSELEEFQKERSRRSKITDVIASKDGHGETYIVVIGESHNKHQMSLYGYPRKTTPWLDAVTNNDGWVVFSNAFSCHTHTIQVFEQALTGANQYNDINYVNAPSIIDIAKNAGFETAWISNQAGLGSFGNLVTVLAETTDIFVSLNRHIGQTTETNFYDEELIHHLDKVLSRTDSNKNRLIFVHLMGNHSYYCHRYPEEYSVFEDADIFDLGIIRSDMDRFRCYDNTVLYVDNVLKGLFEVSRSHNAQSFFYFSDHGEAVIVGKGHNASRYKYEMSHIPMIAWFSKNYKDKYTDRYTNIQKNKNEIFTNDLLYDTLIGITGIRTGKYYEKDKDLTSENYTLDINKATTLHGKFNLIYDPYVIHNLNINKLYDHEAYNKIIGHRINTQGGILESIHSKIPGVHIDIIINKNEEELYLEVAHDIKGLKGNIKDYVKKMEENKGIKKIFINMQIDEDSLQFALEELESIQKTNNIKNNTIVNMKNFLNSKKFASKGWHTSYNIENKEIFFALESEDEQKLNQIALHISEIINQNNFKSICFEEGIYKFIKKYLEPLIKNEIFYHILHTDLNSGDKIFHENLLNTDYIADERVVSIIITGYSRYVTSS